MIARSPPRAFGATAALADHLRRRRVPDVVLCSSARRARETLDGIAEALGDGCRLLIQDELYGADVEMLIARLRRLEPGMGSVLLIGHNPGLQELVMCLAGDGDEGALESIRHKFATAALATLSLPGGPWSRLGRGVAYLESVFVPRDRR
jgi:phosphohistidine phosphatase